MSPRSLAVLCGAVGALLFGAPAAQAACTGFDTVEHVVNDPANDVEGVGPDLTTLTLSLDAAVHVRVQPGALGADGRGLGVHLRRP